MRGFWKGLVFVVASGVAFGLAAPNPLFLRGLPSLAFFFFLPAAVALEGASLPRAGLFGGCFAIVGYGVMNAWLANYEALAPLLVLPLNAIYYAILFLALRLLSRAAPSWSWLTGSLAWVGMEYAKTLGFLGYPYGILGYTQYAFPGLIHIASCLGVFGVSFLVLLPQMLLGQILGERSLLGKRPARAERVRGYLVLGLLGMTVLAGCIVVSGPPRGVGRELRIGLVQPNLPTDRSGARAYRRALDILTAESRSLIREGAELVAWPETAFVPSIAWHERYRSDRELYDLVRDCREFMTGADAAFLIGNNQGEAKPGGGALQRIDYNAALAFPRDGGAPAVYRKSRLVPFSEYFPYGRIFPGLALRLEERAGGFWAPGPGPAALSLGSTRLAAPICFEDGFGELVRAMVLDGAELVLPLVNDAWSRSEAAEWQHLACSVFRAVETGRPVARCTNSGITALIDGRGRIRAEMSPFERGGLLVTVGLDEEAPPTPYLVVGDLFGRICLGAALGALFAAILGAALGRRARAGGMR